MDITEDGTTRDDGPAGVIALVPLRMGGKSRLGDALVAEHRDDLVLAMLDDVLAALRGAGIADIRLLAGCSAAATAASGRGLTAITDPPTVDGPERGTMTSGDLRLRAAVDAALAHVPATEVRLVVAADLPRLSAAEVVCMLTDPSDVAIAPTAGGGTAVLRLAPGVTLPARYGPGSAGAHAEAAELAGWSVSMLDLPGGRRDVDAAADLAALSGSIGRALDGAPPGPATTAFVTEVRG
jgi:2-phospho-L-lactate guanylyltransferase